jgi:hypothetical protein
MARSLGLAAALMLGFCASTSSDRYSATGPLMIVPGKQALRVCLVIPLSLPPPGCGGVEVRGVDVWQVPGAARLSNGAVMTDPVRVVGTWDGTALSVTEPPRRATQTAIQLPTHAQADATPRAAAALQRLVGDSKELDRLGIYVMECTTDGDDVAILVPVADGRTVRTLEQRYGPVEVQSWLQRVSG